MNLGTLFSAIDAKPFRPFAIEIVSGRRVEVDHPDNIFILPNRQKVDHIEVYGPGPTMLALIWVEGIAGVFFDKNGNGGAAP